MSFLGLILVDAEYYLITIEGLRYDCQAKVKERCRNTTDAFKLPEIPKWIGFTIRDDERGFVVAGPIEYMARCNILAPKLKRRFGERAICESEK